jgi:hypothetical protein
MLEKGDAVRFIGFSGNNDVGEYMNAKEPVGLVVHVHEIYGERRYDVLWPNGRIGNWLYEETLTLVSKSNETKD